jgi:hypothetical protein
MRLCYIPMLIAYAISVVLSIFGIEEFTQRFYERTKIDLRKWCIDFISSVLICILLTAFLLCAAYEVMNE